MRVAVIFFFIVMFTSLVKAQVQIDIPQPYGNSFIESELIEEVSILPLKYEQYGLVRTDMEMKVDGEDYFILDNQNSQCVYHFNSGGELADTIRIPKGKTDKNRPQLNNPAWFSINPYDKQIEIYRFENSTINRFTYNGKYLGKIELEVTPSDFARNKKGEYWVYAGWNNSETQYRLIKTNAQGSVIGRELRLVSKCTPTEGFAFFATPDRILFWELLNHNVYAIENDIISQLYEFNFGAHNLPRDYHMMHSEESFTHINQTGYYSMKKVLENETFTYFFLNFSNMQQREMFHVLHNKNSGAVHVYTENSSIGAFDKAQYLTENNELVFLVSPRQIRRLLSSGTSFIPAPFANLPNEIRKYRNPVILKIKLQEGGADNTTPTEDDYFDDSDNDNMYFDY
ncbi:MAG: 6-bladed beta-propeller [Prolixibacteraceae bacterium]|nr:6-bladed beta-propeller [Prolixibacteraceae bacterium]